ncbi:MAG: ParB/RepB/Spo0J family partition protein, partial [Clostridia bacterium]|nr:ParB/RepB/Spo0J family partition protein [Clostridia bacterium]
MKVVSLPIHSIFPNPAQPRKFFDTVSLEELTESIEEFGILQPVTVRKVRGGYELVAGERRFRAAQNAGLDSIPAIILNVDEKKSALLAL